MQLVVLSGQLRLSLHHLSSLAVLKLTIAGHRPSSDRAIRHQICQLLPAAALGSRPCGWWVRAVLAQLSQLDEQQPVRSCMRQLELAGFRGWSLLHPISLSCDGAPVRAAQQLQCCPTLFGVEICIAGSQLVLVAAW